MSGKKSWILFIASCLATVLAGWWAMRLVQTSECVHFNVNFPTQGNEKVLSREELGGPWTRLPAEKWTGYPPGGHLVWGREGEVRVDIGRQGFLKRILQPWDVTIGTHWLRNVGVAPRKIGLELDMCGMPVAWDTFEREWDKNRHASTREIPPGKTFNMDWHFRIPVERRNRNQVCQGGLKIFDAGTDRLLAFLPITLLNSRVQPSTSGAVN